MIPGVAHRRQFKHLSEQEVLALAISSEEDDARIYGGTRSAFAPATRSPRRFSKRWRARKTNTATR